MKKLISALFLITLVISICCSAVAASFDYTQLTDLDGYSYDKFEKTWMYQRSYLKEYSDAYVAIGFSLEGDTSGISYPPIMYCKILNTDGSVMHMVSEVYFLVGEKLYHFDNLLEVGDVTSMFLGSVGKQLIEDLAQATEVSVKLVYDYSSVSLDIPADDYKESLKTFAKTIIKYDVFSLFGEADLMVYDTYADATVE
jgi:hypothetical protein